MGDPDGAGDILRYYKQTGNIPILPEKVVRFADALADADHQYEFDALLNEFKRTGGISAVLGLTTLPGQGLGGEYGDENQRPLF